jgi:pyruvate dehydrogenase E2 component (dihydrolipoamide acetyltransferase)
MPIAIQLPALSPTMKEGKITKWLKKEGDKVSSGTAVAECETDKSNLEIEAYDDGTILKILVPEGGLASIGSTIAWIGKPGEAIPAADAVGAPPVVSAPAAVVAVAPAKVAAVVAAAPVAAPIATPLPVTNGRLRASPLAKKMAEAQGVDLARVAGSGPSGRVVKRDIEAAMAAPRAAARPVAGVRVPPENLPVSGMRRVIAQRLTEVKPGVPHFYLQIEVEMDQALALKDEAKQQELKISVNDIIIKATAVAVRRFPRINQVFAGDVIQQLHNVDVGVAVAIEDGLITPLVRDADQKGLADIAAEVRELAERAKKKSLKPEEYTGGSITVSNLGMFGIDSFIAVINPPHAAILAVGKVEPKVVVRDDEMVIRKMMSVTLSGDHRVIDGAVGAQFLQELKSLLERPLRLVF